MSRLLKSIFRVILLILFVFNTASYAQNEVRTIKIYSGFLVKNNKNQKSLFGSLFNKKPTKPQENDRSLLCFLEFKCPAAPANSPPVVIPKELIYSIGFKNVGQTAQANPLADQDFLRKFIAKIYSIDGLEFTINLNNNAYSSQEIPKELSPGQEIKIERHLYDPYTIYMVLSQNVHHVEVFSLFPEIPDAYALYRLDTRVDQ